jgi:hypothetical protein
MKDKTQTLWSVVVVIVVVLIIGGFAYFNKGNGGKVTRNDFFEGPMTLEKMAEVSSCSLTSDKDAFAKCLTEKGWTMYGAEWCGHCKDQKALFGDSFQYIKYVECPNNTQLCLDKGINGYPTWRVEK